VNECPHCDKKQYYIKIKDNKQFCNFCKKEIKPPPKTQYTSIKDSAGIVRI